MCGSGNISAFWRWCGAPSCCLPVRQTQPSALMHVVISTGHGQGVKNKKMTLHAVAMSERASFYESLQVSPACPSGNVGMPIKMSVKQCLTCTDKREPKYPEKRPDSLPLCAP